MGTIKRDMLAAVTPTGILHPPGSHKGPCGDDPDSCSHTACAAKRMIAAQPCACCRAAIGYDEPYVRSEGGPIGRFAHTDCLAAAKYDAQVA